MVYKPTSLASWAFLILILTEAATVLALEGIVFVKFQHHVKDGTSEKYGGKAAYARIIPTYFTLFIFAWVFELVLAYDALRLKNTIQIIGLCIFNLAMMVYSAIQIDQIKKADSILSQDNDLISEIPIWPEIKALLFAIPVIIAAITVAMCAAAWKLYDEFAWTIYKHISADLAMRRRYLTFQVYISILKFDFFFFLGFTVQFVVIVVKSAQAIKDENFTSLEFGLTIAVIPCTIAVLFAAAWTTRRERKDGMICVIILYFGALSYFLFKLVRMYQPAKEKPYIPARKSLTTFAVITIVLILLTIANAIMCMLNFDKGLKPHITRRKIENEEEKHHMSDINPHNISQHHTPPSRMIID